MHLRPFTASSIAVGATPALAAARRTREEPLACRPVLSVASFPSSSRTNTCMGAAATAAASEALSPPGSAASGSSAPSGTLAMPAARPSSDLSSARVVAAGSTDTAAARAEPAKAQRTSSFPGSAAAAAAVAAAAAGAVAGLAAKSSPLDSGRGACEGGSAADGAAPAVAWAEPGAAVGAASETAAAGGAGGVAGRGAGGPEDRVRVARNRRGLPSSAKSASSSSLSTTPASTDTDNTVTEGTRMALAARLQISARRSRIVVARAAGIAKVGPALSPSSNASSTLVASFAGDAAIAAHGPSMWGCPLAYWGGGRGQG
mmetsp:Transcript_17303/g.65550  ORF Transcript_17303/g.65550 Transcript_17303/m.65550 type:complete len:317 (-) Transcript_17303:19-969(-)